VPGGVARLSNVTGLVLAGGRGSRMGHVDKGLTEFRGKPLALHVILRLGPQVGTLIINANRNLPEYQAFGVPVVADAIDGFAGPLAGFERGLAHCKTQWLVTAPCDSPFLPLDLVDTLLSGANAADADIAYPITGSQPQPIFCLLRASLGPSLHAFLASGQRKIDIWTAQHKMVEVPFADEAAFANINTQSELEQWQTPR
jgi:molybdenum cofactor guanylyltransferase